MVENIEGFNNNPQNRNNNPENSRMAFIDYKTVNPNKQNNQPNEKEKNIDSHSL